MHHQHNSHLEECIRNCTECKDVCQDTLYNHCLSEGGKHAEADHVKLMTDCIQICQTSADFMGRNSALHAAICAACAEVCEACAKSCEEMSGDHMKHCAEACRACAASCREMSKMKKAA